MRRHRSARRRVALSLPLLAVLSFATSCNLVLNNEKRALADPLTDPMRDAGTDGSQAPPSPIPDAGVEASTNEPDASEPDANVPPAPACPGARECEPGTRDDERMPCGKCELGVKTRSRSCKPDCTWEYGAWSTCLEYDNLCTAGETEQDMMPGTCGACNSGTGIRTRSCTDTCGWTDWSEVTCMEDPNRCEPGTTEMLEPVQCNGMCSSRIPTRTCNSQCTWDAPEMGECTSQGVCEPGTTRTTTVGCNPDFCNKGVQMQMQTCTDSCTWGSPVPIGQCAIPPGICRPVDLGASRAWRCRPNDPGFREYCNAGATSEAVRCTWNGAREPYNGPC